MSGLIIGTDLRMPQSAIVWFRDDLRVGDNPALTAAAATGAPVIACHVLDTGQQIRPKGGASRWWLHHSLAALARSLEARGVTLLLFAGDARAIIPALAARTGATAVHWNRRYGAAEIAVDAEVKSALKTAGVTAESYNSSLLYEPWEVRSKAGEPLRVFSPFWRAALATGEPPRPLPPPPRLAGTPVPDASAFGAVTLDELGLLPTSPDWAGGLRESWSPGEAGALARLEEFLESAVRGYGDGRNRPDRPSTSRLSPHLRFGEIGPRQVWHAAEQARLAGDAPAGDIAKFQAELGWREFSYHLLFHNPELPTRNFQPRFDAFPWDGNQAALRAWQRGRTGYPLVDAGMRELWTTGWMHNRVRMIVASFLVKHLLIDWRVGEEWFWDTLCDADAASNAASWQWVAGSGADAAPYFRVFNPVLQGEKFDPDGSYVRTYVPELAKLPAKFIHRPWTAPEADLSRAGVTLGTTYPRPIVDHDRARARALEAFAQLKPNPPGLRIQSVN
jgi:deoxyribodipyrimidine photo-lyase